MRRKRMRRMSWRHISTRWLQGIRTILQQMPGAENAEGSTRETRLHLARATAQVIKNGLTTRHQTLDEDVIQ